MKMDDKAQTSLEYLVIVTLLLVIAAVIGLLSANLYTIKEITEDANSDYTQKLIKMLE